MATHFALTGLDPLYVDMQTKGISRQRFDYVHRQGAREIIFNVVFICEQRPAYLLFGARGETPMAFLFEAYVRDGRLETNGSLESDEYKALCNLLDLAYDPQNKFSPRRFLAQFNDSPIPRHATDIAVPTPNEVPAPKRIVSDSDRPFFVGWRNNGDSGNVTDLNYKRTEFAFGRRHADFCRNQNISSCWTARHEERGPIVLPEGFA
jgi:hypothetical protein